MDLKVLALGSLLISGCSSSRHQPVCHSGITLSEESDICILFEDESIFSDHQTAILDVAGETVSAVNNIMPLDHLVIHIVDDPVLVIPEIGLGGYNPAENEVIISIDPDFIQINQTIEENLMPILAHEMHHAARRRTVGYGSTLLEAMISEGLADHFAIEISHVDPPAWSVALTGDLLTEWINKAKLTWHNPYDHGSWFLGTDPNIPRWAGYSIGFDLVNDFLKLHPNQHASTLFNKPASSFIQ